MADYGNRDPLGTRIDKHFEHLKGKRSTWERHWQELAEYVLPHRSDFTSKRSLGEERLEMAFEGTAMRALKRFASQIHNVFTPMGAEWFKLTTGITAIDKQRDVQLWLEEASKIVKHHISRPSSNFHSAIYQYYLEAGAFGTGIVFVEDIPGIGPRFRNFPLSDCVLAAGGEMEIDTIYRLYKQTAKDLVSRYPIETLPEDIAKKGLGEKMLEEEDVVHLVCPAWTLREFLPEKWDKPYVSITYLKDKKRVIQVGAYDEMPYICARWERSDREIYGRGPAWEVLPDMRLMNEVEKVYLKGVQKAISPPMFVPDSGLLDPLIRRTVHILMRSMMLGKMPPVLEEIGYRIEYINPISISLRSGEVNSMVQLFEMIMPLAQIDQTIPMYFDTHKILQNTAEVLQVPASNLRTQEEVAEILRKQQQQQALQQEQQQAQVAAQVDERQANAESKRAQARAA